MIPPLSYLKMKTKLHLTVPGGDGAFCTAKQKGDLLTRHTKSHLLLKTKGTWVPNASSTVVFLYSVYQSLAVLDNKWPEWLTDLLQSYARAIGCAQCQQQTGYSLKVLLCHAQESCLYSFLVFRTSLSTEGAIKSSACCGLGFFLASF